MMARSFYGRIAQLPIGGLAAKLGQVKIPGTVLLICLMPFLILVDTASIIPPLDSKIYTSLANTIIIDLFIMLGCIGKSNKQVIRV